MSGVKWIKIATQVFDNRKIRQIENMPEGDSIIVIWFKILCLAGNTNDGGLVYFTKDIPYTEQMLSSEFNRPLVTVQLALSTFKRFEMIDIIDDFIHVSSWEKYQNIEGLERIREQTRLRVARHREGKAIDCNVTCNATVTHGNETDIDIDREEDKDIDIRERIEYQQIADMYNNTCVSLPKLMSLSETRKKAIKARLNTYTIEDLYKVFELAEQSEFLKGKNDRNWSANFDWLIKDSNMAKVLDGNYANRHTQQPKPKKQSSTNKFNEFPQRDYDYDSLEQQLLGGR